MIYIRRIIYFLITTVVILIATSSFVLYQALEENPLVIDTTELESETLIAIKKNLKSIITKLNSNSSVKTIHITHQQISHLLSLTSHSIPSLSARYNQSGLNLLFASTVDLPENPFGSYLNISTEFYDNNNIFKGSTKIGSLSFSNQFIFNTAFFIAPVLFDRKLVNTLKNILTNTKYTHKNFSLGIPANFSSTQLLFWLKHDLKKLKSFAWNDTQFSSMNHYYRFLDSFSRNTTGLNNISLLDYLNPLFTEVKAQSIINNPVDENTNALLALALFVGDYNLRNVLSKITKIKSVTNSDLPSVRLANRNDLMLHFIYSYTIEILSSTGLSLTIGELKEVYDMDNGGSGFSFADLAADRAGVQFSMMATDKHGGALHLQNFMADSDSESNFFPEIFALPEGLGLTEFKAEYQNTKSREYQSVVSEIDRRIQNLPLFRKFKIATEVY